LGYKTSSDGKQAVFAGYRPRSLDVDGNIKLIRVHVISFSCSYLITLQALNHVKVERQI
jgi:hypothetical protein